MTAENNARRDEIQRLIEQDHDVTVRGGVVTSEPCRFNHGYGGPSRRRDKIANESNGGSEMSRRKRDGLGGDAR